MGLLYNPTYIASLFPYLHLWAVIGGKKFCFCLYHDHCKIWYENSAFYLIGGNSAMLLCVKQLLAPCACFIICVALLCLTVA